LVDTTQTCLQEGMNTGIQRVVRNVALRAESVGARLGVEIVPVVARPYGFCAVLHPAEALAVRPGSGGSGVASASGAGGASWLGLAKRLLRASPRLYEGVQRGWYRLQRRRRLAQVSAGPPVHWRDGDVLLLLDRFWGDSLEPGGTVGVAQRRRGRGVSLVGVVYDMIPCTHPQFFDADSVGHFTRGITAALTSAEGLVAISATVAEQVNDYAASLSPQARHPVRVDYSHLGSDFAAALGTTATGLGATVWPDGLWTAGPVFLMLGTLEPRKGHAFVLEAFAQRWAAGARETLLFIGKPGWSMGAELERFRASPQRGRCFFISEDAGDAAVVEAIARSRAGILASTVEGFGLPLVEFMQKGLPVLASDIPVFREVGGDYPLYFALDQPACLAAAVDRFYAQEPHLRRRLASFRWPNWDAAAEALIGKVIALARAPGTASGAPPGAG
jgi:alpha-1,2-rhamnosyltransferase